LGRALARVPTWAWLTAIVAGSAAVRAWLARDLVAPFIVVDEIVWSEIARGIDIFALKPSKHLTENEIAAAAAVKRADFNAQEQPKVTWPAVPVVARAYIDQLTRSKALADERVAALNAALDRAAKGSADKAQLQSLASEVERSAASASGRDAERMKSLAETLRGIAG